MQMFRPEDRSLVSVRVPSSNSLVGDAVLCELDNLNSLSTQVELFVYRSQVLLTQLQLFFTLFEKHHLLLVYIREFREKISRRNFMKSCPGLSLSLVVKLLYFSQQSFLYV